MGWEGFFSVTTTCQKNSINTDELYFCYEGGHSSWPCEPRAQIFVWLRAMRHTPQRLWRKGTSRRVPEAGNINCSPGPCCHSWGWSGLQWPLISVPGWLPLKGNFSRLACHCQVFALHSSMELPQHLACPGLTQVGGPHLNCFQAPSHCYSTRTQRKNKLEIMKSVITLLTVAVSHAVFVSLSHLFISYCVWIRWPIGQESCFHNAIITIPKQTDKKTNAHPSI